jgi:ABC-type amino acid transport system permease subunit
MGQADRLVTATAQAIPVLAGAALFYYSLTLPLAAGINYLERRQRIVR